jgi:4-amino-4-deoxy-L-arabinose transferase-like glycosyltransferase
LLAAVAVVVVAWALLVPPFQVPDEAGHFSYVQSLVENGERPVAGPAWGGPPRYSSEQRWALTLSGALHSYGDTRLKPVWDEQTEDGWERVHDELRPDRGDIAAAGAQARHSPLYYGYEAVPYAAASGGDLFDRLYLMRLWSGVLMLVTTLGAWLLVGELTGRDRLLQLAGAACVGLQPMATFVSAGVNPDAALFAASSVSLWLGVRILRRGPTRAAVAGLLAATALAAFAKAAGLALLPGVLLVLVVAARRRGVTARRWAPLAVGASAAVALAALLAQRELGRLVPHDGGLGDAKGFASYLWQFYLPKLPFQESFDGLGEWPLWHVWHKTSWGAFGQLEVEFPDAAYGVFAVVALAVAAAAVAAMVRGRVGADRAVAAFFGLFAVVLLLGLHWVEFRSLGRLEDSTNQGRYLLPLMPIVGVAVAAALTNLPRPRRAIGAGVVLAGMVALQLLSLATVAGRFYA